MGSYATPLIAIVFAFGGLLLGGAIGIITKQFMEEQTYNLYAFCGGVLFGLLCLDLIPDTFSEHSPIGPILGIVLGFLFMMLAHTYFHVHKQKGENQQALQIFLFLSLAICIHNIPTGMALGSALVHNKELGSSLLLAITIHHIPEGLALIIPFLFTKSKTVIFVITVLLLSVVLGMSTILGGFIQSEAIHLRSIIMGSAIGTLGYVAIYEMLWKAKRKMNPISFFIFTLTGLAMVQMYIKYFMGH
ncbi:ZIP family metal transporter [Bacillus cereus]|uniref:ZIP family metal transporter n=1 Tax=Bacillus cereus TaxID=1396 RepID=UPI00247FDC39|nr:ZIP family metal transporter [Bacillus cereus]MDH8001271.1 ZIP family metal transporter [Bacillus cereus]